MGTLHLYTSCAYPVTTVSNRFIDTYLPSANGEFVKVYLCLLRFYQDREASCSITAIADLLNHTENDVLRALRYWERQGLLTLECAEDGTLCGICIRELSVESTVGASGVPAASMPAVSTGSAAPAISQASVSAAPTLPAVSRSEVSTLPATAAASVLPIASAATATASGSYGTLVKASALLSETAPLSETALSSGAAKPEETSIPDAAPTAGESGALETAAVAPKKKYTTEDVQEFGNNPDIQELFFITQTYLKHTLSSTETNAILYWYDGLKFPAELIEYLIEYCISKGHSSTRYMDKVAIGWAQAGIQTVEQARENAALHSQIYYTVMKALGICGRNLVPAEMAFVNKWSKEYAFNNELIQEACARTMAATHQPSFEYTDSILTNWHNQQVKSMADVKRLDQAFDKAKKPAAGKAAKTAADSPARRNKFNNFNQRTYDGDQLEQLLLKTSVR